MFGRKKKTDDFEKLKKKNKRGFFKTIGIGVWNIALILSVLGWLISLTKDDNTKKGIQYDYDYNTEISFAEDYISNYYNSSESSKKFIESHSMSYINTPKLQEDITVSEVKAKDVEVDNKNIYIKVAYKLNEVSMTSKVVISKSKRNTVIEQITATTFDYKKDNNLTHNFELDKKSKTIQETEDYLSFLKTFYTSANDSVESAKQFYSAIEPKSTNMLYDLESIKILAAGTTTSNNENLIINIDEVIYDNNKVEISRQSVTLKIILSLDIKKIHEINRGGN